MTKQTNNKQTTKRKGHANTKNNLTQRKTEPLTATQQETRQITKTMLQIASLPKIDILNDKQLEDRLQEYFYIMADNLLKPTITGMALALGINRQQLYAIRTQKFGTIGGKARKVSPYGIDLLQKACAVVEGLWEQYMQEGKMNPIVGIFLAKNHFGYKDKSEHEVVTSEKVEIDAESIRERYQIEK